MQITQISIHKWKKPYWQTTIMTELVGEKKKRYNRWVATKDPDDHKQYTRLTQEVKKAVSKIKSELGEKMLRNWQIYTRTKTKTVQKMIHELQTKIKVYVQMTMMDQLVYYSEMNTEKSIKVCRHNSKTESRPTWDHSRRNKTIIKRKNEKLEIPRSWR